MNALTKIYEKTNTIRYKKIGKKYVQVNDPWAYEGLQEGWWLVKVAPGSTSIRQAVRPAAAELAAAARDKEADLIKIILKAGEAWHRSGTNILEYPSPQEQAERIIEAILQK